MDHSIFVAPLCLGLLFLKRKQLANVPIHGSSWGLLVLFLVGVAYWAGALGDLQYVGSIAIQFFVAGLVIWFASDAVVVTSGQPDQQLRQQHTQKVEAFASELAPVIQLRPQVRPHEIGATQCLLVFPPLEPIRGETRLR
jgi:hypothetical protein